MDWGARPACDRHVNRDDEALVQDPPNSPGFARPAQSLDVVLTAQTTLSRHSAPMLQAILARRSAERWLQVRRQGASPNELSGSFQAA
jgi:hypothetical protein